MKRFKKIYIEITNICNLMCEFCPQTTRESRFMEVEEFEHIIDEVKGFTDYIYFHVKGEPFLHPNMEKLLDISHKASLKVNITTNGTLLSKIGETIVNKPALRQINISLHSYDGNVNSYSKEEYLNNIFEFIELSRRNKELIISLRLWNLSKDNINTRNKEILERIEREFGLDIKEELEYKKGIKISERIYLNQDYEFIWPDLKNKDFGGKGYCYGLKDQIAILVDGTVVPCCLDGEGIMDLGNIFNEKLGGIILGERATQIYENFSKRIIVEEMCRKCGFRTRF